MFKSIFKKGIDNLRFALNLDDYIPEHIIDELRSEQEFLNEVNSNVGQMFSKSRPKLKPTYNSYKQKQIPFDDILGYDDLKELLTKCLTIKDSCNVLLSGPPASSKTVFLLSVQKEVSNACFVDGANASGPGLIDYLFEHPDTHVICIDELDKLKKGDQTTLLNLLETGTLSSTKVRKTRSIRMEGVKVIATSNDVDRLIGPLRSRFLELELPEYTWDNFLQVTQKLLQNRHGLDETTSGKIAQVVWSQLKTRDIRDVLAIAKLTKSSEDVEFIAATLQKYKRNNQ
ncbi:MAG: AAA family ATPase [Nitrososphaeraceae archaeon]|jgi:replication-associated recombination protein RarA